MTSRVRTQLHTPNDLKKILKQNSHRLDRLCWCIEARWSSARSQSGKVELLIACHPDRFIPLIFVGCCPDVSREWADLLRQFFADSNKGRGLEFGLGLICLDEIPDNAPAYEWGRMEWDCVCKLCAAVFQSTNAAAMRCQECIDKARREPRRKGWPQ